MHCIAELTEQSRCLAAPSAKRARVDTEMEVAEPVVAPSAQMDVDPPAADESKPFLEGKSVVTLAPLVISAPVRKLACGIHPQAGQRCC